MNLRTFNSFRNRNFRLFFMGQSVSLIGTWMQKTAVSWVVYSVTQSKFMLGVSVFATLFPTAVFSLYGGIVADRYDRYRVLLATQIISLVQAALLALAVVFFREYVVWEIIILGAVLGVINGFDMPVRQSLVREMVEDPADLPNALALNSSMVNLSKLIGPAIAGLVLELYGDTFCFGLNAFSFIPVIISLLMLRLPPQEHAAPAHKNLRKEFAEAFSYIRNSAELSSVILFVAAASLLLLPFSALTPVFAKDIFHGSASTLGVLDGVIGLGAFAGAIFLASLRRGADLSRILAANTLVFGAGLILFAYTEHFPAALICIAVGSFGMMSVRTLTNTIMQIHAPNRLRGRIISIYLMVLTGLIPIGSLLVGAVSHYIGVQLTVFAEGILALMIAAYYGRYLRKDKIRREELALLEQQPDAD